MTIQEINAAARAEGLTYGQYVDRHKDDPEPESEPKAPEEIRTCQWCGTPFRVPSARSRQKFCGPHCKGQAQYAAQKQRQAEGGQRPTQRACVRCGTLFDLSAHTGHRQYCSDRCRDLTNEERRKERRQARASEGAETAGVPDQTAKAEARVRMYGRRERPAPPVARGLQHRVPVRDGGVCR